MSTNQNLLEKADLALSDLSGAGKGGLLNPEQSDTFIRKLIKQPSILRQIRVVSMNAPKRNINKIQFNRRILRKGVQGTALTAAQRSSPITEQIVMETDEVIAEVHIAYDVMEDNIERATAANNEAMNAGPGGLRDTILTLIAERAALDLEELALLADTGYTNSDADDQAYLSMKDGFLEIAKDDGNTVDFSGAEVNKSLFKQGMQTMPDQYLRNRAAMRHFVSVDKEIEYVDTLANRATMMGDSRLEGQQQAYAYGVPVEAVQLMPNTKGLFTHPMNLLFGIQRQVSMEYDKDIQRRVYVIVLTARIDFKIEEPDATVYYTNIKDT